MFVIVKSSFRELVFNTDVITCIEPDLRNENLYLVHFTHEETILITQEEFLCLKALVDITSLEC